MGRFSYIQICMLASFLMLAACKSEPNFEENRVEKIEDFLGIPFKPVEYDEATADDIAPHVSDCQGNKFCVNICHKPPGNPENSKHKKLPLKASLAHMGHGDTLGDCGEETPAPMPEPEPEPTPEPTPDPDLPAWCLEYIDIDADCDGYTDDGNFPLY